MKIPLKIKESNGQIFYFVDFGRDRHYKPCFRLWVHESFVKHDKYDPYFELPATNASLVKGRKQPNIILRPGQNYVFDIFLPKACNGADRITNWEPTPLHIYRYIYYRLLVSELVGAEFGYLIETNTPTIKYYWEHIRNNRYEVPFDGATIIDINGNIMYTDDEVVDIATILQGIK